jgi:hypothetical protein
VRNSDVGNISEGFSRIDEIGKRILAGKSEISDNNP